MRENPFVENRGKNKQNFLEFIKKNRDMSKRKLIAIFFQSSYLSGRTLERYWEELEDAELI